MTYASNWHRIDTESVPMRAESGFAGAGSVPGHVVACGAG
jgi:hypothetical protein